MTELYGQMKDDIDYANSTLSFPQKLFALLENENGNLIQWASHGLCFRILDADRFAGELVPKYFKRKFFSPKLGLQYD
jgi:hypothetical protein